MSTPYKLKRTNVNAPFKSPLRSSSSVNTDVQIERTIMQKIDCEEPDNKSNPTKSNKPTGQADYDSEIEKYVAELMQSRSSPIDIDEELKTWRNRMHAYNEAKDACLVLFGQLAHIKGCLVKELYEQHGLELDD